ncbi:MAG: hypothetical protein HZA52_04780 [Planctomycetes bacterium]|nr:hypothetical protein [Planctomycetota bacterium]
MLATLATLASLLIAGAVAGQEPQPAPTEPPAPRVALVLVADRTRLTAGETFELGVRYVVPPGWHIHWTNPGDGATRTQVDLTVPDGFTVAGPSYPGPERFDELGGRVHYGYTGEVVVLYRVTAPKELVVDTHYTFSIQSRWLAHGERGVMGENAKKLRLEPADLEHPAKPNESALFEKAHAREPRPWKELADARAEWSLSKESGTHLFVFRVEHVDRLEFYPALDGGLDFAGRMIGIDRDSATVTIKVKSRADVPEKDQRLRGVLRVDRGRTRTWYQVDFPR